jgi:hypothetical protein
MAIGIATPANKIAQVLRRESIAPESFQMRQTICCANADARTRCYRIDMIKGSPPDSRFQHYTKS